MGGDGADLQFDRASVAKFTQGVGATIDELGDLGGATGSVMGKGFSELSMTGMEAGHHGLSVDFEDFCERWEWGVRALVSDASAIANRLGLAAGTQWEHDQYVEGTLKVGVNSVMGGNPHATEEEITQQDWGDVFTPDSLNPDWSAESWEQAGHRGPGRPAVRDAQRRARRLRQPVEPGTGRHLRPVAGGARPAGAAAG